MGSSPLTRGKRDNEKHLTDEERLIPAHAGKTMRRRRRRFQRRAHPRSRGENGLSGAHRAVNVGSSPLTRGKLLYPEQPHVHSRLIPAHAGKTYSSAPTTRRSRAHPRSRGENARRWAHRSSQTGSSPLTRGKPDDVDGFHVGPGLIPAHAGKTVASGWNVAGGQAHPRSRGENAISMASVTSDCGSSPLTRGKPAREDGELSSSGLIPAHAGKTPPVRPTRAASRAHPRSRGENLLRSYPARTTAGSSPLTRGKLCDADCQGRI